MTIASGNPVSRSHVALVISAAVMLYAAVTAGGLVCITGSGAGCAGWPRCDGQIVPPARTDAIIEYLHRLIAILTGPAVLAAAVVGWRSRASNWWISRAPAVAAACVLSAGTFGAIAVTRGLPASLAAVDRGCALAALGLMVSASVAAILERRAAHDCRMSFKRPFARLTLATAGATFALFVTGVLVAENGSVGRCYGWPIHISALGLTDLWAAGPELARQLLSAATAVLLAVVVVLAWLTQRGRLPIVSAATIVGVLFAAETAVGLSIRTATPTLLPLALSVVTTSAFWTSLVALTALAALSTRVNALEPEAR